MNLSTEAPLIGTRTVWLTRSATKSAWRPSVVAKRSYHYKHSNMLSKTETKSYGAMHAAWKVSSKHSERNQGARMLTVTEMWRSSQVNTYLLCVRLRASSASQITVGNRKISIAVDHAVSLVAHRPSRFFEAIKPQSGKVFIASPETNNPLWNL